MILALTVDIFCALKVMDWLIEAKLEGDEGGGRISFGVTLIWSRGRIFVWWARDGEVGMEGVPEMWRGCWGTFGCTTCCGVGVGRDDNVDEDEGEDEDEDEGEDEDEDDADSDLMLFA